ncbi:MAG TPA: hypothetical protein V6D08_06205 [Candidatus Obscuribacterales bacterium]
MGEGSVDQPGAGDPGAENRLASGRSDDAETSGNGLQDERDDARRSGNGAESQPNGAARDGRAKRNPRPTLIDLEVSQDIVARSASPAPPPPTRYSGEMAQSLLPIESYRTATECEARWELMKGTDRCRRCLLCGLNVYDFTDMELPEAMKVIRDAEAKEDCTLYRRRDGRFLTADCPLAAGRRKRMRMMALAAIILLAVAVAVIALMLRAR